MALIRITIAATAAAISVLLPSAAMAADGYWLDQYNALLFVGLFRLDTELEEMKEKGAAVVMVHADSLPDPLLRWIAWRANRAKLKPVAWIQRPTADNLTRVSKVSGYKALQVDDHFFAKPPLEIGKLRSLLSDRSCGVRSNPGSSAGVRHGSATMLTSSSIALPATPPSTPLTVLGWPGAGILRSPCTTMAQKLMIAV